MTLILDAVLGWSNPGTGPTNLRLYARDRGNAPRWDGEHGRVLEQAVIENLGQAEGSRFLLVHLGNRFIPQEDVAAYSGAIEAVLSGHDAPAVEAEQPVDNPASLKHQRDLLADVLRRILVASGGIRDIGLSGPELLMFGEQYAAHLGSTTDHDDQRGGLDI